MGAPDWGAYVPALARTLSPTSSGACTDRDSVEDCPEIGGSVCCNPTTEACRINMVGLGRVDCSTVLANTQ
jgi:hypothetical protein